VNKFLPINPYYEESKKKYGNPFTFDDVETINPVAYQCPFCGATDRDRLYALYLCPMLEQALPEKRFVVLDIAPSLPLQQFLLQFQSVYYQSVDKYMQGVDITLDISDMKTIQDNSYDFFICSHVLEHVPDDRKALSELFRVLKPGGFGILMVPINLKIEQIDEDPDVIDVGERWRRFGQDDHVRLYSKQGFVERVEKAGFTIQQYGVTHWNEEIFFRYGISLKSVLYIGKKQFRL
jgi:SAM-dependent methyltransferase